MSFLTSGEKGRSTNAAVHDLLNENVRLYLQIRRAYDECSREIQEVVDEMIAIFRDQSASEDERTRALHTITDAIFPSQTVDVVFGCERRARVDESGRNKEMVRQEAVFSEILRRSMEEKDITQEQLARMTGVSQPAISNMLKRQCRPQTKTIEKLASALGMAPNELWPTN